MLWPSELDGRWLGENSGGVEKDFFFLGGGGGGFSHPTSSYFVIF